MKPFSELLEESAAFHGHLCPGQVLGVRMAMAGCWLAGIDDPRASKNLIVYVEIDRCATDAIQSVTGCKLGKRTLKYLASGWWVIRAVVDCSGWSWNSSERVTPMRSG